MCMRVPMSTCTSECVSACDVYGCIKCCDDVSAMKTRKKIYYFF